MAKTSIPFRVGDSVEDQAICFFFSNYLLADKEPRYGSFEYIRDICTTQQIGTTLSEVLVALGLAGLSTLWKAPDVMITAHRRYASAVKLISSQLSDSQESKSDQMFVAVMALSLFEVRSPLTVQNFGGDGVLTQDIDKYMLHTSFDEDVDRTY